MTNDILNILNKYCKLDDRRQIKYICPSDFMELANKLEEVLFLSSVSKSFYCETDDSKHERCSVQCEECKQDLLNVC